MITPIINKSSLSITPSFSQNIADSKVNAHIQAACEYFRETVSRDLYDAMITFASAKLAGTDGAAYGAGTAYTTGKHVLHNGSYWTCLQNCTGETPEEGSEFWEVFELGNLWADFIVPYLAFSSYHKFLAWAGRHVTDGGIRVFTEDKSTELFGQDRAALRKDIEGDTNIKYIRMMNELRDDELTYDGTTYTFNDETQAAKPRRSFGIMSV